MEYLNQIVNILGWLIFFVIAISVVIFAIGLILYGFNSSWESLITSIHPESKSFFDSLKRKKKHPMAVELLRRIHELKNESHYYKCVCEERAFEISHLKHEISILIAKKRMLEEKIMFLKSNIPSREEIEVERDPTAPDLLDFFPEDTDSKELNFNAIDRMNEKGSPFDEELPWLG